MIVCRLDHFTSALQLDPLHDISFFFLLQKKREREGAILQNSKLTPDQRGKWLSVTKKEYMSSEESGEEDCITVHPLPWRSQYVTRMFSKIDAYIINRKSAQAKRQMKKRQSGTPSTRSPPGEAPDWAVDVQTSY